MSFLSPEPSYICDEWPTLADGQEYDGLQLLALVRNGNNPFSKVDMSLVIEEVEAVLGVAVVDIPLVTRGSNNYVGSLPPCISRNRGSNSSIRSSYQGLHCKLSNQREVMVRLGRSDVNMPNYDGFDMDFLLGDINFEAATYKLLETSNIPASRLLYFRLPVQHPGLRDKVPTDLAGRRLMVFEKADGRDNVWRTLSHEGKVPLAPVTPGQHLSSYCSY
jgi:hypothetical protein